MSLQIFGIKFFNVKCSVKSLIEKGSLKSTSALDVRGRNIMRGKTMKIKVKLSIERLK